MTEAEAMPVKAELEDESYSSEYSISTASCGPVSFNIVIAVIAFIIIIVSTIIIIITRLT
jgi:hypothetical protein